MQMLLATPLSASMSLSVSEMHTLDDKALSTPETSANEVSTIGDRPPCISADLALDAAVAAL